MLFSPSGSLILVIAVSPNALTPILRRVPGNEILFIFLQSEKVLSPIPVIPDATVTVFIVADLYEKSSVTLTSPFFPVSAGFHWSTTGKQLCFHRSPSQQALQCSAHLLPMLPVHIQPHNQSVHVQPQKIHRTLSGSLPLITVLRFFFPNIKAPSLRIDRISTIFSHVATKGPTYIRSSCSSFRICWLIQPHTYLLYIPESSQEVLLQYLQFLPSLPDQMVSALRDSP